MTINTDQIEVRNNPEEQRFEVIVGDKLAMVQYRIVGGKIVFIHTKVPPEFEGMGIASKMARVALEYAKAQGLTVQARCPYIAEYVRKHPEYQSITLGY